VPELDDEPLRVWVEGDAVKVVGDLDMETAPLLTEILATLAERAPSARLVVDLSEVEFVDSQGLRALIHASTRVPGEHLVLRQPSQQVRRLLELTGLEDLFAVDA
jgi:anti-sigma B factor antagonist